ncbi:MAG: hypothetical protein HY364_02580 [Candidatus Aenigmarchaeota archaeon]|nr:hypothetical protein [Candidatus Aenigmarchaeota archaeon]
MKSIFVDLMTSPVKTTPKSRIIITQYDDGSFGVNAPHEEYKGLYPFDVGRVIAGYRDPWLDFSAGISDDDKNYFKGFSLRRKQLPTYFIENDL